MNSADLIFIGNIITVDDSNPIVETLAIKNRKIITLGDKKYANMIEKPWRYFKNKGKGRVYVRPEGRTEWIPYQEWISSTIIDKIAKKKYCRACGSEIAQNHKYCNNCGESL